jgi:hypothetical protein
VDLQINTNVSEEHTASIFTPHGVAVQNINIDMSTAENTANSKHNFDTSLL